MFYNLVHQLKKQKSILMNKGEYDLLFDELKTEIMEISLNEEKEDKKDDISSLSIFEKSMLNIANNRHNPLDVFDKLREITENILENEDYQILDESESWDKELFACEGALEFLFSIGFEYNKSKTLLICSSSPSSECISNAMNSLNTDRYNPYKISWSPFMSTLIDVQNIQFFQENIWVFSEEELNELKNSQSDQWLYSNEEYYYKYTKQTNITFSFAICREVNGSKDTGFLLRINSLPLATISGKLNVSVDDVKWFCNDHTFYDLGVGDYHSIFLFKDDLVKKLGSLTLRVATYFD